MPAPDAPRTLPVAPADAGVRLDAFLADRLAISRAQAQRWLARGAVAVNQRRCSDKGLKLAPGDAVTVTGFTPEAAATPLPDDPAALRIAGEGDGWVIVDKPAGVPVHPLEPGERGTVLNALVARYPGILGVGEGGLRSGVVHRIDVETSGCVAFATAEPAWHALRAALTARDGLKRYVAAVAGHLRGGRREEFHLVVAQHRPARVRVLPDAARGNPDARLCHHTWRALRYAGHADATLVEIDLGTGFLHQIRAAFAHAGHPVLGDTVYGPATANPSPRRVLSSSATPGSPAPLPPLPPRLLLHASELRLGIAQAVAELPPSFSDILP